MTNTSPEFRNDFETLLHTLYGSGPEAHLQQLGVDESRRVIGRLREDRRVLAMQIAAIGRALVFSNGQIGNVDVDSLNWLVVELGDRLRWHDDLQTMIENRLAG